jgi:hypothetical protein
MKAGAVAAMVSKAILWNGIMWSFFACSHRASASSGVTWCWRRRRADWSLTPDWVARMLRAYSALPSIYCCARFCGRGEGVPASGWAGLRLACRRVAGQAVFADRVCSGAIAVLLALSDQNTLRRCEIYAARCNCTTYSACACLPAKVAS